MLRVGSRRITTAFKQLTIVQEAYRAVTDKRCVFWKVRFDFLTYYFDGIRLTKYKREHDYACDEIKSKYSSYAHGRHSAVQSKMNRCNFSTRYPNLHVTAENQWKLTEGRECCNSMLVNKWPFTTDNKLSMHSIFPSCV
jgi:hypothetical protein